MDGNGRWAKMRGLPRTEGHRAGIERIKETVRSCSEIGVKALSLFAFSTENWKRPKREVNMLMRTLGRFLTKQLSELNKNNIKFLAIGRLEGLPSFLQEELHKAMESTKNNSGLIVNLALNYGSRSELVDATKRAIQNVLEGKVKTEEIDENTFTQYLYTAGLPDPDLLIRTSGEMRISNFLLWQASYAELYFSEKYWPDFDKGELLKAIREYARRERRFGGL
jgi:undecaprenyl diphosphate synthase